MNNQKYNKIISNLRGSEFGEISNSFDGRGHNRQVIVSLGEGKTSAEGSNYVVSTDCAVYQAREHWFCNDQMLRT